MRDDTDGRGNSAESGVASAASMGTDSSGPGSASNSNESNSASNSGPTSGSTSAGDSTPPDDDDSVFDVNAPDVPPCSGSGNDEVEFSYIWVANSAEGTVSKIDTATLTEVGRYVVRPDSAGNPSRTSVNLSGDVAIANRAGDITKIYAREEDCQDTNGMPGIQTSSGAGDVLAWDVEECRAWYVDMPYNVQRPVAWTSGTFSTETCAWEGQKVWTTGGMESVNGSVHAILIDGDSGVIDEELPVPEINVDWAGPYGGAVDSEGDFWFHSRDHGLPHPLVHVEADGMSYEIINVPDPVNPYGITVDSNNRVWLAGYIGGIGRYDPIAGTWDTIVGYTGLGIQEDAEGRMWLAIYPWDTVTGVHALDVNTMAHLMTIDMTGTAPSSRGISIDFDGYVWMVDQNASAWKIDPDAGTWTSYDGLTGPYTYSDMTGWGLSLVTPG